MLSIESSAASPKQKWKCHNNLIFKKVKLRYYDIAASMRRF